MFVNDTTIYSLVVNITTSSENRSSPYSLNWSVTSAFDLVITICALLTNGSFLFLFVQDLSLLNPFTIYIANLSIANILCALFFDTLDTINSLYTTWWLGSSMCTMYGFSGWAFIAAMRNAHALIALNRFWAVTFPTSYRQFHKKKFALLVCVAMWVYIHVCILPGILLDAYVYRPPMNDFTECSPDTHAPVEWQIVMQLLISDLPVVVVLAVYPVVCYKVWSRSPRLAAAAAQPNNSREAENRRKSGRGILALTLMTLTLSICYVPDEIYYTMQLVFAFDPPGMHAVTSLMWLPPITLDPIWFILTLEDLRLAFRQTYLSWLPVR